MAYRDWDQHDHRGTVRRREEQDDSWDYKKRRRYDDGDFYDDRGYRDDYRYDDGYQQNYGPGGGRSRGDDDWRTRQDDEQYDYHPKSHPKGKRMVASEATQHVIFLGLDPDFVEADLAEFVRSYGLGLESVTIIRDRNTGASRSFGFVQFPSIEEAQKFVEPNFPFVMVPPPASHGASAMQAFNDGTGQNGRRVKIDYSQSAAGTGSRNGRNQNDGTRDIGNTPSPVVLLRGLDPISTLDIISEALKSSAGTTGQGAVGMKRIILIRDNFTAMGIGLAFVEFIDTESASQTLAATMSRELHPEGFRISNRPVATSFASPSSFQPLAPHSLRDGACIMGSTAMGGVEGVFAKYWDDNTTVVEMAFQVAESATKKDSTSTPMEKRKKKKPKDDDAMVVVDINEFMASAIIPETKVSTALPANLKPLTLSINKTGTQIKPAVSVIPATPSVFMSAEPDEPEPIPDNKPLDKAMTFRKVAPLIASKKVASSINKWNEVSSELRSGPGAPQQPAMASTAPVVPVAPTPRPAVASVKADLAPSLIADDDPDLEFCILEKFTCYLCARQLKSQEQLKRHVKESDLHKARLWFPRVFLKNLLNEALQETAREKVAKVRGTNDTSTAGGAKSVYRDRASERRVIHGQPDAPLPEPSRGIGAGSAGPGQGAGSKKIKDVPLSPPAPPTPPPKEPAKDENNIGNKLLKKMGWSEGTGLGLSGEGRVDPIQTAIYASGAGLGASKGRDITRVAGLDYAGLTKESVSRP
ncbi:hypothetical protein FRC14_005728 [Serendipita sp. 396]|nr:hypothetical protein FRC14_005728 [Serendipita sp. 396]